jgi:hypothetical protein
MSAIAFNALLLGIVALALSGALLALNQMLTGYWWRRPGLASAMRADQRRLHADVKRLIVRRLQRRAATEMGAIDAIVERLAAVETLTDDARYAAAAESAQWLQWEALRAQLRGAITHQEAKRLLDDAQALCENLWAADRTLEVKRT